MKNLSISIDEMRGIFKNIEEKHDSSGLFPFESLKNIYKLISALGYGASYDLAKAGGVRSEVIDNWHRLRQAMLQEFDRDVPFATHSPYVTKRKAKT